jgi:DNA-binding response OmpR family regulator
MPGVFMAGLTETEHVVRGFEVGGIDYVTKPIRAAEVLAWISTHLRNARLLNDARQDQSRHCLNFMHEPAHGE